MRDLNAPCGADAHRKLRPEASRILFERDARQPGEDSLPLAHCSKGRRAHARAQKLGARLTAHIIDANAEMMRAGRKRQAVQNTIQQTGPLHFTTGIAEALPLPDASADMLTIAFGIRNVTDRAAALKEAHRVLRPGGRFVCLEFSHLPSAVLQKLYDAYSFSIIPPMGALVAGERDAYQYLVESIRRFPTANAFLGEVEAAGFARAEAQLLSGGIAALHMGWRV